jgi:hypothetical protein
LNSGFAYLTARHDVSDAFYFYQYHVPSGTLSPAVRPVRDGTLVDFFDFFDFFDLTIISLRNFFRKWKRQNQRRYLAGNVTLRRYELRITVM